jgi:hypothetical protein
MTPTIPPIPTSLRPRFYLTFEPTKPVLLKLDHPYEFLAALIASFIAPPKVHRLQTKKLKVLRTRLIRHDTPASGLSRLRNA